MDRDRAWSSFDLRRQNLAVVLRAIRDRPTISRAQIATATGLTRTTVSALVADLLDARLVRDIGAAPQATTGRPANRLVPDTGGPVGIGVDIQAGRIRCALVDFAGRLLDPTTRQLRQIDPEAVVRETRSLVRPLLLEATARGQVVVGMVVGVPGSVDPARGVVREAPRLGWRDEDLAGPMAGLLEGLGALGIDVTIRGEVETAAASEPDRGAGLYLGGEAEPGLVVVPAPGNRAGADTGGMFGHRGTGGRGRSCRCGRRGCLVTLTGPARADAPDAPTVDAGRAGTELARAVGLVLTATGLATVVVGGRVHRAETALVEALTAELRAGAAGPLTIRRAVRGADAVVRGAGTLALAEVVRDPAGWMVT